MRDATTTKSGPSTRAANLVVLLIGLWLMVSWTLYDDQPAMVIGSERHVVVGIVAGLWLLTFAGYQLLSGASHLASVLTIWTGIALVILPVALRYGYLDRIELAYVNHIVSGLLVIGAGVYTSRRTTGNG